MSNYAIQKPKRDQRHALHGLRIADGEVVVVSMTKANKDQLDRIERYGYRVEETEVAKGRYSEADFEAKAKPAKKAEPKADADTGGTHVQSAR